MKRSLAATTAVAALVLTACGSETPDTTTPSSTAASSAAATETESAETETQVTVTVTETAEPEPASAPEPEQEEPLYADGLLTEQEALDLLTESFDQVWEENDAEGNVQACTEYAALSTEEREDYLLGPDSLNDEIGLPDDVYLEHILSIWDEHCSAEDIASHLADKGGDVKFGRPFVYEDGLEVIVTRPEVVSARGGVGGESYPYRVHFDITITNNTGERVEPMPMVSVQSGKREGDEIFDIGNGISGPPMLETLLDGRSLTWTAAFGVDDPDDVLVFVEPDFLDYAEAVFSD